MRRRTFLTATASAAGLAGCLSPAAESPADPPESSPTRSPKRTTDDYWTPVRRTADGVAVTFEVLDVHAPTEETASAQFADDRVTVTGSVDPAGCRRPSLTGVGYDPADGRVRLVVGSASTYGPTATVECGNASFDYEAVATIERGRPTAAAVVHDHHEGDDRTFAFERA